MRPHYDPEHIEGSRLSAIAQKLRLSVLDMIQNAGEGHYGGSLSVVDILTVLLFSGRCRFTENKLKSDRLILSKGHAAPALYAALAYRGWPLVNAEMDF